MVLILANDLPPSSKFKVYLDIVKLVESGLKTVCFRQTLIKCSWALTNESAIENLFWVIFYSHCLGLIGVPANCYKFPLLSKRFFVLYSPQDGGNPLGFPVFSRPVIALFSYK